jgi:hypothetical protein
MASGPCALSFLYRRPCAPILIEHIMQAKKIPRHVFRIVGIKQEKEGGKRQKPKGASKR